jgi:WS/DGAT/MGAT family acyltransferase
VLSSNAGITQSDTPLNGELSLHRNVEWMETSLKDIKAIKNAWHCSINDVLLVIVTGAMRQYLGHRGVDIDNTPFRVGMPISIRSAGDDSTGNQISFKLLELPIAHGDTQTQLQLIREQTLHVDKGSQSLVVKSLMALVEYVPGIMPMLARGFAGPGNCYLTNIPGPGFPLYQLGAELDSIIPVAPLNGNMGLCIGAMSYNGKICWGLIGDPDLIPDIDVLVKMIADCRAAIRKAVKAEAASTRASAKRGKATGKKQPASVAGKAGSPTA